MTSLHTAQLWLQAAVTGSPGSPDAVGVVVASTPHLSAAARVAIYARAYKLRLLECLRSLLPGLHHALGDDVFTDFALDYIETCPPRAGSLDRLADRLPSHLDLTRPTGEEWPYFLVELASLEVLCAEVLDGPGIEDAVRPERDKILAMSDTSLLDAVPVPAPCLRLRTFHYPVHTYLTAVRRGRRPVYPAPARSFVAVTRRNWRVHLFELAAAEHDVLSRLDGRRSLREAGKGVSGASARVWLLEWTMRGFIERVANPFPE